MSDSKTSLLIAAAGVAATVLGIYLTHGIEEDKLRDQRRATEIQAEIADTQRRNAEISASQLEVAQGQLEKATADLARERDQSLGTVAVTISDREAALPGLSPTARSRSIQLFAAQLHDLSPRGDQTPSWDTPLPNGTSAMARALSNFLASYPTVVDLSDIDVHGMSWSRAHLDGMQLVRGDLRAVNLSRSSLAGADFKGADLQCANLQDAVVAKARFVGTDLRYANLRGVDLSSSEGLTSAQVQGADIDADTRLPEGVSATPAGGYIGTNDCAVHHISAPQSPAAPAPSLSDVPSTTTSTNGAIAPSP